MAVAVWDKQPTPQNLLSARVENGWQPIASDLQDGARILGYASCLVDQ